MSDVAETIFDLVPYELWCHLQAIDFRARWSDEACRRDFGFGLRTPHRTMSHIADVMRAWSGQVGPKLEPPTWPDYDDAEPLAAIRRRIVEVGDAWAAAARAPHAQGVLGEGRRLNQLFHLVTHGHHHRGQLLSMITLLGHAQPFEGGDYGGWSSGASTG